MDVRDPGRVPGRRPVHEQPGCHGRRFHRPQRRSGRRRRHPRLLDGVHDLHGSPVAHHGVADDRDLHPHGRCRRRRRRPRGGRQLPPGRAHYYVADPRRRSHADGRFRPHDGDRDGGQGRGSRGRDRLRPRPRLAHARRRLDRHGPHEPARLLRLRGRQARVPHGHWSHDPPGDRGLVDVRPDRRPLVGCRGRARRDRVPTDPGHYRGRVGVAREPLRRPRGPAALLRVLPGRGDRRGPRGLRPPVAHGHPHRDFVDAGPHGPGRREALARVRADRPRVPHRAALRCARRIGRHDAPAAHPPARARRCGEHPGSVLHAHPRTS